MANVLRVLVLDRGGNPLLAVFPRVLRFGVIGVSDLEAFRDPRDRGVLCAFVGKFIYRSLHVADLPAISTFWLVRGGVVYTGASGY